jgi:hypothetical protein
LNRRALAALLLLLVGYLVISNTTYRKRKQERAILDDKLEQYAADVEDALVDVGVLIHVVEADPNGTQLFPGKPKMRVLREHKLGGILDRKAKQLIGPSRNPLVWHCSVLQEGILFNRAKPAQLVEGSEGAGKTTVLAQWHYVQWMRHLGEGREGLQTAPTNLRLGLVKREIGKLWRPEWYRYVTRKDFVGYELCDGSAIRMVSTHKPSEAGGSPVQGFNSSWAGRDETQDQTEVHDDIESRGREARDGWYPQLGTATVKDSTEYFNLVEQMEASGEWSIAKLLMCRPLKPGSLEFEMVTPFVTRAFVESKMRTMSEREFRRRFFAERQTPELAVYYGWDRTRNLVDLPHIGGGYDATVAVLQPYQSYLRPGGRFALAAGHDPGAIFNTSEVAKLIVTGRVARWTVVGELQTMQTNPDEHAALFREYVRRAFDVEWPDSDKIAVFCDPHGKGDTDTDYQTHYGAFQANSIDVFSPAPISQRISRTARIGVVNRLAAGTAAEPGVARVVVAKARGGEPHWDTKKKQWTTLVAGNPVAPALVEAFETMKKRPGDDDPEGVTKKDEKDKTHAPAALGYLLWPFEQQAITEFTVKAALAAAGIRA